MEKLDFVLKALGPLQLLLRSTDSFLTSDQT